MEKEGFETWSLEIGEVSPKIFEDSFELIAGKIYEPLQYIKINHEDNTIIDKDGTSKDSELESPKTQSEKEQKRFGVLPFEEPPEPPDINSCLLKEMEKISSKSRQFIEEINGTLITIKEWIHSRRDKQLNKKL